MNENHQIDARTARQQGLILNWRDAKGRGGIKAFPGFGKTYMTIKFAIIPVLTKREEARCIIIVHRVKLKKQWENTISNFDMPQGIKDRIEVFVVNTIIEQKILRQCTFLVLDEVSEYYGEETKGVWDYTYIDYKFLLWLDATPYDANGVWKELFKIAPMVGEVTREEGLAKGWTTNSIIYNIGVELTEEERELYTEYTNIISDGMGKFGSDFDLAGKCARGGKDKRGEFFKNIDWATKHAYDMGWDDEYPSIARSPKPYNMPFEDYRDIIDIDNLWNPEKIIGYGSELFEYTRKRKFLLAKATNKIVKSVSICRKFSDKKIAAFSQSTEFAANLCKIINEKKIMKAVEYHSNIKSSALRTDNLGNPDLFGDGDWKRITTKSSPNFDKPKIFGADTIKKLGMEWFTKTETGLLSMGSALDKGLDIPDIQIGLVTSMNNKRNQHEQRKGRSTRLSDNKENAIMIYIYCKDTQDVNYLRNIQYKEGSDIFWIDSVDEIEIDMGNIEDKTLRKL